MDSLALLRIPLSERRLGKRRGGADRPKGAHSRSGMFAREDGRWTTSDAGTLGRLEERSHEFLQVTRASPRRLPIYRDCGWWGCRHDCNFGRPRFL